LYDPVENLLFRGDIDKPTYKLKRHHLQFAATRFIISATSSSSDLPPQSALQNGHL
jgi:hypothetical protein